MKLLLSAVLFLTFSFSLYAQKDDAEHPCANDVIKYCKGKDKDKGEIVKCLNANDKKLSKQCKAKVKVAKGRVHSVRKDCKGDIQKFCIKGTEKIKPQDAMKCLREKKSDLSPACKAIF